MCIKGINILVKQTVVEHLEIPIRYHENTFDIRISFLQSMNYRSAGLIKIALTAVQKNLDPTLYRFNNCLFNFRFFDVVTISVVDEKNGFIFVCHKYFCIKKAQQHINVSYAKNTRLIKCCYTFSHYHTAYASDES